MTVSMLLAMVILFVVEIRLASIPDSGETKRKGRTGEAVAGSEDAVKGPPAGVNDEKAPTIDPRANLPRVPVGDPRFALGLGLVDLVHGAREGSKQLEGILSQLNRTGIQGPPRPPLPPHNLILENLRKQKPFLPDDGNDPFAQLRNESVGLESNRDLIKKRTIKEKYADLKTNLVRKYSDAVARKLSDALNHDDAGNKLGDVGHINETATPIKNSSEMAWEIWQKWVKPNYLYPEDAFWSDEMNQILNAMATAPITSFGVGHKGTQLKATMMLGEQKTAFKPMR